MDHNDFILGYGITLIWYGSLAFQTKLLDQLGNEGMTRNTQ